MPITKRALEDRFLAFLREHADTSEREGLLVAVSGGCDSTALLQLVLATKGRHRRPVFVGHVNHGIRPDADTEEERLRVLCEERGVPFVSKKVSFAEAPGEAELRDARYGLLGWIADQTDPPSWILLGHQEDDQAETVLLHLVRGTGLAGLTGMRERRDVFLRPLLSVSRAELQQYLEDAGVPWTDDPTNLDMTRARNRIRHVVLPMLERDVRPRSGAAIARAASHLGKILDHLRGEASTCLNACRLPGSDEMAVLDARRLYGHHPAVVEEALRTATGTIRGSLSGIPATIWTEIARPPNHHGCRRFDVGENVSIEISPRFVRILRASGDEIATIEAELPWSGRTPIPPLGTLASRRRHLANPLGERKIRGLDRLQVFDADRIRPPLKIRPPRDGDRIQVFETSGSRKVVDLLSERGVPRPLRRSQPVLEDADGILWLPGIRRAMRALLTNETERVWMVRWFGELPVDSAPDAGQAGPAGETKP